MMIGTEVTLRNAPAPSLLWFSIDPTDRGDGLIRYEFYADEVLVGFGAVRSHEQIMLDFDALVMAAMRPLC